MQRSKGFRKTTDVSLSGGSGTATVLSLNMTTSLALSGSAPATSAIQGLLRVVIDRQAGGFGAGGGRFSSLVYNVAFSRDTGAVLLENFDLISALVSGIATPLQAPASLYWQIGASGTNAIVNLDYGMHGFGALGSTYTLSAVFDYDAFH